MAKIRQKKHLGQVFLKNRRYIDRIAETVKVQNAVVCEIGPGDGALTEYLLDKARKVFCVEYDSRLHKVLEARFADCKHIRIIRSDILKVPFYKYGNKIIVVGNIPYNITTALIKYLISNRRFISKVYLTIQKEFAQKLVSPPGKKEYSFFSCYVQYYAKCRKFFDIPQTAFKPAPKVTSSFIELDFSKRQTFKADDPEKLFKLINQAFVDRHAVLKNSIPKIKRSSEELADLWDKKAYEVSLADYIKISNVL
ncbi:MAG: 16S rRNA (adenine(1518)-N(6)/adenine(1519)-N(6))-dimethyltransferase RsmA [Candidatus Omnitrophica bacterium]|nr:16S rRNA (adenine(1518)-N(6)/adenine(1519)-N(6))-dimethyltransferase RsmA [Candidatus Omnitrophota bacterium]